MITWPTPTTLKGLRGFLGITGCYRRFIKDYGKLSKPLMELLKKDWFQWGDGAQAAFVKLKEVMTQVPVLALPDYTKPFTLEVDACGQGMGAVLSQEGKPIAYLSKAFSGRNLGLSTYDKEFLAILMAVDKWKHYLSPRRFLIKTDHQSLKYLLEQKITTTVQQKGMVKLMGFDYAIQYRAGRQNKAADALSRRGMEEGSSSAITAVVPSWVSKVIQSYKGDDRCQGIITALLLRSEQHPNYTYS